MADADDLERRLRAVESSRDPARGFGGATTCWHRNPDGPEAADEIARLRAENEALRAAVSPVFKKLDRDAQGQGPGHGHTVPGVWDDDSSNGENAGKPCEWCAQWERARTALKGSSHE